MTGKRLATVQKVGGGRYVRRLVTLDDPAVVEKLEELARNAGHSVGSEVLAAVRYWIRACEDAR